MKLRYVNRPESYEEWAENLWNRGWNYSVKEACDYLRITDRYFRKEILPYLNYTIYRSPWLFKKINTYDNGLTFVNKEDLADWLMRNSTYQKQTEFVDMYTYLLMADKDKASHVAKLYNDTFTRNEGFYRKGTIPQKVFNIIRKQFNLHSEISNNLDVTQRRKYSWKDADHVNIFEKEIYFPSDYKNEETCYRNAFLNGDVKMTIGRGKTIFIKTKQDTSKMKIPFLVQADARMLIR